MSQFPLALEQLHAFEPQAGGYDQGARAVVGQFTPPHLPAHDLAVHRATCRHLSSRRRDPFPGFLHYG